MPDPVQSIDSPQEIAAAAQRLRRIALEQPTTPLQVIEALERGSESLRGGELDSIAGVAFLRLWLRRGTLEPIVARELGVRAAQGEWQDERAVRLRVFPLGVVGHWPAANIEIQPLLSMSCALLGGNACLVRVPAGLVAQTRYLMGRLQQADASGMLTDRIRMVSFDHERTDLQQAMAAAVDGAMIWGGAQAVTQIRALPFPDWARVAVFGPRLSVAALDAESWGGPQQATWCQRIARDVWQFDQQACSSPQALFLERHPRHDPAEFVNRLAAAFETENRIHPRRTIHPAMTSAIALARASWLLEDSSRRAIFPDTPDWTILIGEEPKLPTPTQGRTLSVLLVPDLMQPISTFDGMVQTLGLAMHDHDRELAVAQAAATYGVDRIVKLGRMHVFGSPWDGTDMIRPMVRLVRHMPSTEE
jgi:hypothetical protein